MSLARKRNILETLFILNFLAIVSLILFWRILYQNPNITTIALKILLTRKKIATHLADKQRIQPFLSEKNF